MKKRVLVIIIVGVLGFAGWWITYRPAQIFNQEIENLMELERKNPGDFDVIFKYNSWRLLQEWLEFYTNPNEINDLKKLSIKQFHDELLNYRDWLKESAESHFIIDIYVDKEEKVIFFSERIRDWSQYLGTNSYYWTP